ncbi:unnamed protein product [Closterium sp. Yama58-4]|nr:unnamed protein product [Closterium sp. Yama58-4]
MSSDLPPLLQLHFLPHSLAPLVPLSSVSPLPEAVPKRILEIMNVQGLTRENVASHLQKYRLYLKRLSGVNPQPHPVASFQATEGSAFGGTLHVQLPGSRSSKTPSMSLSDAVAAAAAAAGLAGIAGLGTVGLAGGGGLGGLLEMATGGAGGMENGGGVGFCC